MKGLRSLLLVTTIIIITGACSSKPEETTHKFEGTVESLRKYETADWFRNAKFGIYMHWGVYSVVEQGEWYPRKMYDKTKPEYKYHQEHYGHQSTFGYKDFIPMWKAENFNPDELVSLFKEAGAKYFSPCAVHHDNFDLWDSKHHKYNAVNMGPEKDLIGMFKEATLKQGLRFGVTTHLSRSYSWLNTSKLSDEEGDYKGVPYDGNDPEWAGLYHEKHDDIHPRAPENAPKAWRDLWALRIKDLIDNYDPDILYFDCAIPFRGEDNGKTGMDVIAHLYNNSMENHNGKQEAVMCIKERPWQGLYADGVATLDFERGKAPDIRKDAWQTDDSMGPWGYRKGAEYMSADATIDKLIDIVSKNGNMLLNVPIKADGTLDDETITILKDIGAWFKINGEGIYGTRPWYIFGEGKTNEIPHHIKESPYTSRDYRYTTKGHVLYAFILDWPGKKAPVFQHLAPGNTRLGKIQNVELLGHQGEISWEQKGDGLTVKLPKEKPCENAYALKITFDKELDHY